MQIRDDIMICFSGNGERTKKVPTQVTSRVATSALLYHNTTLTQCLQFTAARAIVKIPDLIRRISSGGSKRSSLVLPSRCGVSCAKGTNPGRRMRN